MDVFTQSSVIGGDDGDLPSLVDEVRSGKPAALERLIARVQSRVRTWAVRFTGDEDTADDVAQQVLIGLDRRVKRFDGASRFTTWLFAVTRNAALSERRKSERRTALFRGHHSLALVEEHHSLTLEESSRAADPDAARLAALVVKYFDALPRRQRQIFELADLRGLTPTEIAERLGMEAVTVRGHLFKARRAIRAKLLEHHERLLEEYTE
jgi:RNA polymerase sigma-70 factor (ECF subfamily)